MKKDITRIVDQYLCHSCGSCYTACDDDSISYTKKSVGGYLFPEINYDTCTECTMCYVVCPGDHFSKPLIKKTSEDPFVGDVIGTYIGKATNELIYRNSQSGGAVTAILKNLLDSNQISAAIITVMNTDNLPESKAVIVTSSDELLVGQKSKYVPTNITSLIPDVLNIEGKVAMVGLSCHMHGLENLVKVHKELKDKIIKIGLICERVMLNSAVEFLSHQVTNDKVTDFIFKDTARTGYLGDISVSTKDKIHIVDKKYRKVMKNYFTPARCYLCFDKMNIYSDIVIGDPHGFEGIDRIDGESLVFSRTSLGEKIVEDTITSKEIVLRKDSLEVAVAGQGIELKRKKFNAHYRAWEELGYDVPKYPESVIQHSIEANQEEVKSAKKALKHAISLDDFESREALLEDAASFYEKKTAKKSLMRSVKKLFGL